VPELAHVPRGNLHAPWTARSGPPLGYEPPIVDHAEERAEALRRYGEATDAVADGAPGR
jgi:deoxyribodipyrimidine photo-lyase